MIEHVGTIGDLQDCRSIQWVHDVNIIIEGGVETETATKCRRNSSNVNFSEHQTRFPDELQACYFLFLFLCVQELADDWQRKRWVFKIVVLFHSRVVLDRN